MAVNGINIEITGANGMTLKRLQEVIKWRAEVEMKPMSKDAVIATVITALKSIRKITRENKSKKMRVTAIRNQKLSVAVENTLYKVGLRRDPGSKKSFYVILNAANHRVKDIQPWWQVAPQPAFRVPAKVFRIVLSDDRIEAWGHQKKISYIVAHDREAAIQIVEKRFGRVVKKSSGLGKSTLGRAMALVSDRPANLEVKSASALEVTRKNAHVKKATEMNQNGFGTSALSIEVIDSLRYAIDALEGGEGAIDQAIQAAANSVVGYVNKKLDKEASRDFFAQYADRGLTPFPDAIKKP